MKDEKKIELKFRETEKGKRLFKYNLIAGVLYVLSFIGIVYVILSEGKVLTGLMTGIVLFAILFAIYATFLVSAYYHGLQEYIKDIKKVGKREG